MHRTWQERACFIRSFSVSSLQKESLSATLGWYRNNHNTSTTLLAEISIDLNMDLISRPETTCIDAVRCRHFSTPRFKIFHPCVSFLQLPGRKKNPIAVFRMAENLPTHHPSAACVVLPISRPQELAQLRKVAPNYLSPGFSVQPPHPPLRTVFPRNNTHCTPGTVR